MGTATRYDFLKPCPLCGSGPKVEVSTAMQPAGPVLRMRPTALPVETAICCRLTAPVEFWNDVVSTIIGVSDV